MQYSLVEVLKLGFSKIQMGKEQIFETIILDVDGRKLETWKVMKKDYPRVLKILNQKWGLNLIIKDKKERDLDWAL
jgi:hypothetical protein